MSSDFGSHRAIVACAKLLLEVVAKRGVASRCVLPWQQIETAPEDKQIQVWAGSWRPYARLNTKDRWGKSKREDGKKQWQEFSPDGFGNVGWCHMTGTPTH